jgi:hypothetical protein
MQPAVAVADGQIIMVPQAEAVPVLAEPEAVESVRMLLITAVAVAVAVQLLAVTVEPVVQVL